MMNGEHPVTNLASSTGVKTRALEIYGAVIPDEEYAATLHRRLNKVFGIAGPMFIRRVIKEHGESGAISFQEDYDTIYGALKDAYPENAASHLSYVTSILIGDFYSSTWIFGLDEDSAYEQVINLGTTVLSQLENTADMDEATRAMNYFVSWLGVNSAHFSASPPNGKCYGMRDEEAIWIYPSVFDQAMLDGGFNPGRVLRDWAERSLINTETREGEEKVRHKVRKYDPTVGKQVYFISVLSRDL